MEASDTTGESLALLLEVSIVGELTGGFTHDGCDDAAGIAAKTARQGFVIFPEEFARFAIVDADGCFSGIGSTTKSDGQRHGDRSSIRHGLCTFKCTRYNAINFQNFCQFFRCKTRQRFIGYSITFQQRVCPGRVLKINKDIVAFLPLQKVGMNGTLYAQAFPFFERCNTRRSF